MPNTPALVGEAMIALTHFCVDIKHGCIDRKVLVTAIGTKIIRMVPPLIATEEDCDKAYEALKGAVEEVAGK